MLTATILITTFNRSNLLNYNLHSLSIQKIDYPVEVVILDEGEDFVKIKQIMLKYSNTLNIRYIHTGKNKKRVNYWRIPGYAINIGVKQTNSDIIIISCAEILHINNTINSIIYPILNDSKVLATCIGKRDDKSVLKFLSNNFYDKNKIIVLFNKIKIANINVKYPFLLGIWRKEFMDISGYDEDFIGITADDDDLIGRLQNNGCKYNISNNAYFLHLWHPREHMEDIERISFNRNLLKQRRNIIKRNQNKDWGVL